MSAEENSNTDPFVRPDRWIQSLSVDQIEGDDRMLKLRQEPDGHLIEKLVTAYRTGVAVPPPLVFFDADVEVYWLVDGHQRVAAAKRVGSQALDCAVQAGTYDEAVYAVATGLGTANLGRMDAAERLTGAFNLLWSKAWHRLSDNELARVCRIDVDAIKDVRAHLAQVHVDKDDDDWERRDRLLSIPLASALRHLALREAAFLHRYPRLSKENVVRLRPRDVELDYDIEKVHEALSAFWDVFDHFDLNYEDAQTTLPDIELRALRRAWNDASDDVRRKFAAEIGPDGPYRP